MSRENVELAHRAYRAFNRRDLDSLLALVDAEAIAVPRLAAVEGGYHGHEGIRRWWQQLFDAWPDYQVEVVEVRDLGEITLAQIEVGGRAAGSGIPVRQPAWHVWRWRRKKAVWFGFFPTETEAVEAVGLAEYAMSQANVEVVRRFLLLEVDEALTYVDPDIVWNPAEESATQGHDAVRASLVRWKSEWDDYELLPEEFEHMGDRVVAAVHLRGRGRGSGIEVDARFYEVYTLHEGKILRMDQFTQRSEALEAVGLRE